MNNKVKFLRGTAAEYANAVKDDDTFYYTTDDEKFYVGNKEITGGGITVDSNLSDTSTNPVQNKVIKAAIDDKADKTTATIGTDGLMSAADKTKLDGADDTYALKSKYGDTTIDVGRKAGTNVGEYSTAEGLDTAATGNYSHAEGEKSYALGNSSHAEGHYSAAEGDYSHAEGHKTVANNKGSHAEGGNINVLGQPDNSWSVTVNENEYRLHSTTASGICSHAEGGSTFANGSYSHSEGWRTLAYENCSHAEGDSTQALGNRSHAEGFTTTASGNCSHAEGNGTTASGDFSHSEGSATTASGDFSHASGCFTQALHYAESAFGRYNQSNADTLMSVGDGTSNENRHNAFEITTTGGKLHDKDIATTDIIPDLSLYAKKTDIPTKLPANGGNSDTVNNKNVGMSILTSLDNLGVSYADTADKIWNAIPDSTIFCRMAADFTDNSWNFPSGYASQGTLLIIKLSKNRLGGMYLYPKTGGYIYWANVNSDGSYAGNWKKIQNEIKAVTITASTDSSGAITIPNTDTREYISVISLSCIALPFDGSLSGTRKFIVVNQNLEKQISTSVTFTAYYYDK